MFKVGDKIKIVNFPYGIKNPNTDWNKIDVYEVVRYPGKTNLCITSPHNWVMFIEDDLGDGRKFELITTTEASQDPAQQDFNFGKAMDEMETKMPSKDKQEETSEHDRLMAFFKASSHDRNAKW
jgi:hypothetical protein